MSPFPEEVATDANFVLSTTSVFIGNWREETPINLRENCGRAGMLSNQAIRRFKMASENVTDSIRRRQ